MKSRHIDSELKLAWSVGVYLTVNSVLARGRVHIGGALCRRWIRRKERETKKVLLRSKNTP